MRQKRRGSMLFLLCASCCASKTDPGQEKKPTENGAVSEMTDQACGMSDQRCELSIPSAAAAAFARH